MNVRTLALLLSIGCALTFSSYMLGYSIANKASHFHIKEALHLGTHLERFCGTHGRLPNEEEAERIPTRLSLLSCKTDRIQYAIGNSILVIAWDSNLGMQVQIESNRVN